MLDAEGKNIDAVMIATPDHLHTPVALLCMQQGKHVYCEKPLTRTVWEARLLADAAVKYKVATQMGNQGFNHEGTKTACEILWSGEIGEVKEVHAWTGGIYGGQPNIPATGPEAQPVPATLDWDLWLGPAATRPFNALMTNQWRAFLDFSTGGSLGDWLVHNLGPAHLALQLDKASPISVECVTVEGKNQWIWPLRVAHRLRVPGPRQHASGDDPRVPEHARRLQEPGRNGGGRAAVPADEQPGREGPAIRRQRRRHDAGRRPADGRRQAGVRRRARSRQPAGGAEPRGGAGGARRSAAAACPAAADPRCALRATERCSSAPRATWPPPLAAKASGCSRPPGGPSTSSRRSCCSAGINHQQDWIRACKGGAPGVSEFAVATKYIEWLALGAVALRVPGKLMWDAKNMRFTNNEEANKYLKPFIRKGWEMKL